MMIRKSLIAGILALLGALLVLEINDSPYLPGAHADSVQYLEAGKSLASGGGLTIPIVSWASPDTVAPLAHFPPGFPVALGSVIRATGVRPDVAALWVMAVAAGATLALIFLLVSAREGRMAGVLSALTVGVLPPFALVHAAIWSEPLYLSLLFLTLFLMSRYPDRPALSGWTAAVAVTVRYVGLAAVASVGIWTFLRTRSVKRAVLGMTPGVGVFFLWTAWTRVQGGAVRTLGEFSVPFSNTLAQLPQMLSFSLAPGLPVLVALVLLLGILGTHLLARRAPLAPLWLLLGTHLALTLASRLFVDQRVPFDARILLPVLALAMIPVAPVVTRLRFPGVLLLLLWMGWVGKEDVRGIRTVQRSGLYYTSTSWLVTGLFPWLADEPEDLRIYSNEPGFFVFHLQRKARLLPLRTQDLDDFFREWRRRPGAIVLLEPQRPDEWTPEVYLENLPLREALNRPGARVLVPRDGAPGEPGGVGPPHSHSMVPGGLDVISRATPETPGRARIRSLSSARTRSGRG